MGKIMNRISGLNWLLLGLIALTWSVNRLASATMPRPGANIPWDAPKLVSTNTPEGAFEPVLRVAPNNTLMIMFNRQLGAITNPYFATSTNGGNTWSSPAPVQNSGFDLGQVTLEFDSSNVAHALWRTDTQLFHAAQNQWPSSSTLITTASNLIDPDIDIAPNNIVHVVWAQGNIQDIYHAYSTNGGSSWSTPTVLNSNGNKSSAPAVGVDNSGNVHVVWQERLFDPQIADFRNEIEYMKGTLVGGNYVWDSQPTILSPNNIDTTIPAILLQGNQIHVTYTRFVNVNEQYAYHTAYTLGSGWSTSVNTMSNTPLSVNYGNYIYFLTSMAYCNNTLFVYFFGAPIFNTREQIWGTSSVANQSWGALESVTSDQVRSANPSMLCIGNRLHLAYEQIATVGTPPQVYYVSGVANIIYLPVLLKP